MNTDELFISLKHVFTERVTSPFWGSFLTSWCLLNYKFLMILLSDNSVSTTLSLIETYSFSNWVDIVRFSILYPTLIALAYVFLYPIPAFWFYEYTLDQQLKLNAIKIKKSNSTLLTEEEAATLRSNIALERKKFREKLSEIQAENDALAAQIERLSKELTIEKADHFSNEEEDISTPSETVENAKLQEIDDSLALQISMLDSERIVMRSLFRQAGTAYRHDIWDDTGLNPVEADSALDDLLEKQLVSFQPKSTKGGQYSLTAKGRKFVLNDRKQ